MGLISRAGAGSPSSSCSWDTSSRGYGGQLARVGACPQFRAKLTFAGVFRQLQEQKLTLSVDFARCYPAGWPILSSNNDSGCIGRCLRISNSNK